MPLEIALRVPPCAPVPELVALARRMEAGGIDRASFGDAVARRVGDLGRDDGGDDADRALRLRDQSGHPPPVGNGGRGPDDPRAGPGPGSNWGSGSVTGWRGERVVSEVLVAGDTDGDLLERP